MGKRIAGAVAAVVVGSALAFLLLPAILASFLAILLGATALVLVVAGDWDQHPTFEQRELARARRRAAKRERTAGARAKDRARWEAHQARKAAKAERRGS